jgi:hypothetical protein
LFANQGTEKKRGSLGVWGDLGVLLRKNKRFISDVHLQNSIAGIHFQPCNLFFLTYDFVHSVCAAAI